jgi:hypothetical protein
MFAQFLRGKGDNTRTAKMRPAGEIQRQATPNINIGEALRASGERQRKTVRNFSLDLRREALVVEVTGAARLYRAASVWTAGCAPSMGAM